METLALFVILKSARFDVLLAFVAFPNKLAISNIALSDFCGVMVTLMEASTKLLLVVVLSVLSVALTT